MPMLNLSVKKYASSEVRSVVKGDRINSNILTASKKISSYKRSAGVFYRDPKTAKTFATPYIMLTIC